MTTHIQSARIEAAVRIVTEAQARIGDGCLLSRYEASAHYIREEVCSTATASKYLTRAIREGKLIEITPRYHGWGVDLPSAHRLPQLHIGRYRHKSGGYILSKDPTGGYGPGKLTLVATPKYLETITQRIADTEAAIREEEWRKRDEELAARRAKWIEEARRMDPLLVDLFTDFAVLAGSQAAARLVAGTSDGGYIATTLDFDGAPAAWPLVKKMLAAGIAFLREESRGAGEAAL